MGSPGPRLTPTVGRFTRLSFWKSRQTGYTVETAPALGAHLLTYEEDLIILVPP